METAATTKKHTLIVGSKAFTVTLTGVDCADVYWQHVNPRTGKPWQAHRNLKTYRGLKARAQAMHDWLRRINTAKKEQGE